MHRLFVRTMIDDTEPIEEDHIKLLFSICVSAFVSNDKDLACLGSI